MQKTVLRASQIWFALHRWLFTLNDFCLPVGSCLNILLGLNTSKIIKGDTQCVHVGLAQQVSH